MNREIKEAFKYLKESKIYFYSVIFLFLFSAIAGFFLYSKLSFLNEIILDLLSKTEGLGTIDLVIFIFLNNIQSALLGLFLGLFIGIFPVFHSILNGTVLGYVLRLVFEESGFSEFWRLLPHGIFELPAIFISLGLGLRLFTFIFSKKPVVSLKMQLYYSAILFLLLVLPLLVIAAIIEGLLISFYG